MATLTRLASTLTAKYFPSQTITDAFYIDGRLFGKRETRQADITIDKEERGFFFSVFAHPRIPEYEPGMMPPYEPQLRNTCNEVKFGRKEIDGMIEGFLSTAVDVTGKMRLQDNNDRSPYFAGVIVRDAEAFAVTIGSGLAFLYRDDTLFPLTDAGIPMEPIDSDGNRVGDFLYYCSSKTANALWSNFFTLSPDDCIILCNKEVYDALGQREILRILAEAEDQCDAAGVIITQASARMPNVPMQFSISFVESVTSDEKRGLFGFRKKAKEEDTSDMSIKSTTDGGVVGAAAEAAADAGFTGGLALTDSKDYGSDVMFGDSKPSPAAPSVNQVASADKGIVVDDAASAASAPSDLEFLDTSVDAKPVEMSPEEMMKTLFGETEKTVSSTETGSAAAEAAAGAVAGAAASGILSSAEGVEMKTISSTPFNIPEDDDNSKTKPVIKLDHSILSSLPTKTDKAEPASSVSSDGIIEAALRELNGNSEVKAKVESKDDAIEKDGQIVFAPGNETINLTDPESTASAGDEFNPYSVGSGEEMQNTAPLVFGNEGFDAGKASEEAAEESGIPVPEFDINTPKPDLSEEDKLAVDFPAASKPEVKAEAPSSASVVDAAVAGAVVAATAGASAVTEKEDAAEASSDGGFVLPFEQKVDSFADEPKPQPVEDIPEMPLYDGNTFDTPVAAASSDQDINTPAEDVYSYGQYMNNENMSEEQAPYQYYGNEGTGYDAGAAYAQSEGSSYDSFAQPGFDQASYEGSSYEQTGDPSASYDPYGSDPYSGAAQGTSSSDDSNWIDSILGIGGEEGYQENPNAQPGATAQSGSYYNSYGDSSASAASGSQQRRSPRPANQTSRSGSGNGGNGGRRKIKLNRNGYIFLAFVGICLICLIVLFVMILKSCGAEDSTKSTKSTKTQESTEALPSESAATTPAPTSAPVQKDPSDPIGVFVFSDNTGFRTWWDLFHYVYNTDISSESDDMVAKIIAYNGYGSDYKPAYGYSIYLPPVGVLDGTITSTFTPPGTSTEQPANNSVDGEAQIISGTDEATETQAQPADTQAADQGAAQ